MTYPLQIPCYLTTVLFCFPFIHHDHLVQRKRLDFRNFKSLDKEAFKADVRSSMLLSSPSHTPEEFLNHYEDVMTQLLDKRAPWKTCSLTIQPVAPWYTDEILQLRTEKRKAERKMHETSLFIFIHQDLYRDARNKVTNAIIREKKKYMQDTITSSAQCQKPLFRYIDELLNKTKKDNIAI